jgi:glycosyltransferase involved in cell wall biosynthesis
VQADSAFVAAEVSEAFDLAPARVRVVHPGVPPLPRPEPGEAGLVDALLPDGCGRFVLSVGTAEPRKDLPGLVRAFDRLAVTDVALVLAGPPGWGEAALTEAISQAGSRARIVQTGWVEDSVRAALYRRASVLAYPSLYEGFGFPPLEAMAAGVPVVATRAGSLPEVLGDAALLVEPGDHEGLAAALASALDDAALRQQLVARGTAQAARFSWDRCGDGLVQLYGDVDRAAHG